MGTVHHRQLLAVGGGEGIGAVLVDAHGPQVCLSVAGQGVVAVQGQGGAGQILILFGVHNDIGQAHGVGGIVDHHLVTGGQGAGEAAGGAGGEELHHIGSGIPLGVGVGGEVFLVVFQV